MAVVPPVGFSDAGTNELLAMLEVMYLVAKADGFFSADELREFLEIVTSLSEGKVGKQQLGALVDSWGKRGATDVDERLKELATALQDDLSRRIAYGLAMQIAESDGQFLRAESEMLDRIAKAFGLAEEESDEIAQSVRMSQRPRPA